ncbi:MAG: CoA-binding protein [bacterium]
MNPNIQDFLAQKRIAVAGVSRNPKGAAANFIYCKLRETGHEVFPVNPHATIVEGDHSYPDLKSISPPVDGIVIATRPEVAEQLVHECAEIGVLRVWMHRSFGDGSVSEIAAQFCRDHNITVIPGSCPMMFCEPVDVGHKCIRWLLRMTGGLPK